MIYKSLKRFLGKNFIFALGLGIVLVMSIAALCAPLIAPYPPNIEHLNNILATPFNKFYLRHRPFGARCFSRLLYGGRISLWVGFVAVGISISIGTFLGLVSGYFRKYVDETIMRLVDVMLCFPSFFLILAVIAFLEPSLANIMVVIGLTSWMGVTRLVRADTLSLRERDFIASARLAGCSTPRILFRHILPNVLAPVLITATLGVAGAILIESSLSFLGLGVQHLRQVGAICLWKEKLQLKLLPGYPFFQGSPY